MRIIAQNFSGDVKKLFQSMDTNFIKSSQRLIELFLAHWEEKKNALQIFAEYNSMSRNPNETGIEFHI